MYKTYSSKLFLNRQNAKVLDTPIISCDTIRGCTNDCAECYAKKLSSRLISNFNIPVKVTQYTGKVYPENIYRIGNYGDPATDWSHTETMLKEYNLVANSFCVTKLQSIEGFSGLVKNLQVSLDPLNIKHFRTTLNNLDKIKSSELNIVLRIRSLDTFNPEAMMLMNLGVLYANKNNFTVLETRLRFKSKESAITKYELNPKSYEFRKSWLRPKVGIKFLKGVDSHKVCDLKDTKCAGCRNCINLFRKE